MAVAKAMKQNNATSNCVDAEGGFAGRRLPTERERERERQRDRVDSDFVGVWL